MSKIELITDYLHNEANEKQIKFIYQLLSMSQYPNKLELLKLAGKNKDEMNFDTSYPIGLYNEIKTYYKDIEKANLIYDYTDNNFGELKNINDILVSHILNLKK